MTDLERKNRIGNFLNSNPKVVMIEEDIPFTQSRKFKCKKCKWEWEGDLLRVARTKGCPICSGSGRRIHFEYRFKEKLKRDKMELLTELGNSREIIKLKCKRCNLIKETCPMNYLTIYNDGCSSCKRIDKRERQKRRILKGIKKRGDIALVSEFICSRDLVTLQCQKCGKEWEARGYDVVRGTGCNSCKVSSGEREIMSILDKYNISYISQWMDHNCRYDNKLRFDFKITQKGFSGVIEYHGKQHFEYVEFFHRTEENYEKCKIRDEVKKKYCENKGIDYLEIRYDEKNIEKVLLNFFKKKNKHFNR